MNTTITARIMFIDADDSRITEKFLEDIGWIIPKGRQKEEYEKHVLEGEEVFVEFHILPHVIFRLKERGFDDNGTWFVKRISDLTTVHNCSLLNIQAVRGMGKVGKKPFGMGKSSFKQYARRRMPNWNRLTS